MPKKVEAKKTSDPVMKHIDKSINALVGGTFATTAMILFFSFRHLLPFSTPEISPFETIVGMFTPLTLGILECYRQDHFANRALVNGEKDPSKIRMV